MILSCQHISKSFGTDTVLSDVSFLLNEREKAAVIGVNGAGKTTLLRILTNELPPDSGSFTLARGCTIGYLAQHQALSSTRSIYEELLSVKEDLIQLEARIREAEAAMHTLEGEALTKHMEVYARMTHTFEQQNGYAYQSEVVGVLKGLGFSEDTFTKQVDTLSGGQKTRLALGKLLLLSPDLLLLDEPTNHLDMTSVAWLETYLMNYSGAVLLVSHDRYFLDRVVTKIVEIELTRAEVYLGTYSDYAVKKAANREIELRHYINQQREIEHQEAVIARLRSFNREKSIKRAESREKQLEKLQRLEKPKQVHDEMRFTIEPSVVSGNDVLTVIDLAKAFGSLKLFDSLSFVLKRGERAAIIGANGTGKTTLLKLITGQLSADAGEILPGAKVKVGYYDQEQQNFNLEHTLFEEIQDKHPDMNNTKVRNLLAAFLFTGEDVFKKIKDLSGGERGRLSLAKLMLSEANLLLLDEPTNHLDITSKEILEQALCAYTGTVLYVSHDRYFINKTATTILELTPHGLLVCRGNYDYYLEKKADLEKSMLPKPAAPKKEAATESSTVTDWKQQKEAQARARKHAAALAKTEAAIHALEEQEREIDAQFLDETICTDPVQLSALTEQKEALSRASEALYAEWEALLAEEEA